VLLVRVRACFILARVLRLRSPSLDATEWCLLVTLCFVRNVTSACFERQGQDGRARLATFRPSGCVAHGEVPLLFIEMKARSRT